ncbi:type VI secretion system baseplate subunit TssE, partial [Klebsiella pneumoniae]|nr:type VI secretion system baseplate subunit TssE [Klebsiella pneumoniae]
MPRPSLYDILFGNFAGKLGLTTDSEPDQVIWSVIDNMQRILN